MESIGVRELRQNASKYLERVKRGESIQVTDRGVPIAMLSPVSSQKKSRYDELVEQGIIVPATGDLAEWLKENPPIPSDPEYDGPTVTEILIRMREEERY